MGRKKRNCAICGTAIHDGLKIYKDHKVIVVCIRCHNEHIKEKTRSRCNDYEPHEK